MTSPLDPTVPEPGAAQPPDPVGEEIDGYRILALLGQGGMGRVYKAVDTRLQRSVAIKMLAAPLFGHGEFLTRFQREVQALSSLNHPNIAQIYTAGHWGGMPYYVMEHIEGRSLADLLEAGRRLAGRRCLSYLVEAAAGLGEAHRKGIVHRDIKPSNLMIDDTGHLKIVDFGVARRMDEDSTLTRAHGVLGTPRYMAPEQVLAGEIDHRSDIYSLGATFYHLFAGEPPFQAADPVALTLAHVNTPLQPLRKRNPRIPTAVDAIIGKMMAKRPEDRYQSCDELLTDLHRAQQAKAPLHAGGHAADPPTAGDGTSVSQRTTWLALGFLLAVVILLLLPPRDRDSGDGEAPGEPPRPQAELAGGGATQQAGREPGPEAPPPELEPFPDLATDPEERPDPPAPSGRPSAKPPAREPARPPAGERSPRFGGLWLQALRAKTLANMRRLSTAIEVHRAEKGTLPADLGSLARRLELHPQGLLDAWKRDILFEVRNETHYRLISLGPDGLRGTEDDIVLEDGYVIQGEPETPAWVRAMPGENGRP